MALWVTLIIGLPAALYAEPIIRCYVGEEFLEAAGIMILSLATLPVTGGVWMIWQVSNATGRVRGPSLYVLLTQVGIMTLAYYTVRFLGWGATGVALGTVSVATLPEFFVLWPLALKMAGATFDEWVRETLIPGLTPGIVAAVVWSGLGVLVRPDSWTALGLCTLTGMLCYVVILLAFCLEPKDREDLAVVTTRLMNRARSYFKGVPPTASPIVLSPESGPSHVPAGSTRD